MNFQSLLLSLKTCLVTLEISFKKRQKPKNNLMILSNYRSPCCMPKYLICTSIITCSAMFITVLFVISREWKKNPSFPSRVEWIFQKWCVYTMGYNSSVKKSEILELVGKCTDLEKIIYCVWYPRSRMTGTTSFQSSPFSSSKFSDVGINPQ